MAHHKSAKKRISQTIHRTKRNNARRSRIRTFVKKTELAIASGNQEQAKAAFQQTQPELHRGLSKGVLHANKVARTLSRLSAKIKAMTA